ncbi:MAG: transporter [Ferruginibacter sp.]
MLSATLIARGQDIINTDSPDQSDGTYVLAKHFVQVESNAIFSKFDAVTKGFDNVTLIRYGIVKGFEARLVNQYSIMQDSNRISGIQPLTISFKNYLCKQKGILPELTLVSYFRLPVTISHAYKAEHFGYTVTLAGNEDVSKNATLSSNFGITQDQQTTAISYTGTFELSYNLTKRLNGYVEYFGNYAANTNAENGMDIGFIYSFKNNLAANLAFGSPSLDLNVNRFVSMGLAVRLPK